MTLSFQELPNHLEQTVEVRGFVYRTAEGETVISPYPNLRSCCIGAEKKEQVLLDSPVALGDFAVTLQGVLVRQGSGYLLKESRIVEDQGYFWPIVPFGLALIAVYLLVRLFRRRDFFRGD